MRPNADAALIRQLARELSRAANDDTTVYLTGGATAVLHGWRDSTVDIDLRRERSPFAFSEGRITVRHFDPYSQALSKIWRDFELDRTDVEAMIDQGLVVPGRLAELFEQIEPALFRYPSLDAREFRSKLERTLGR